MTTFTVDIDTSYNEGVGLILTSPSTQHLDPNDTIVFNWNSHTGINLPSSVTISGFENNTFTSTSSIVLNSVSSSSSRVVKSAPTDFDNTLQLSATSHNTRNFTVTITDPSDDVPDSYSLGDNINHVERSSWIEGNIITVRGISNNITTFIRSSGGEYRVNAGTWSSAERTVENGDNVQVRVFSSANFNSTATVFLNIGTVVESWSVKTRLDPGDGEILPLNIFSPSDISLYQIGDLFGRAGNLETNLENYLKGGDYVPDIPENIDVPDGFPISLDDFYGSANSLYFVKLPSFKGVGRSSVLGNDTLTLNWSTLDTDISDTDFYVGYGSELRKVCEYKYNVVFNTPGPTVSTANHNTWSVNNRQIALSMYVPQGTAENDYTGTITFYVRHKLFTGISDPVLTAQCDFTFYVYGE